jgi:ATP-dependent Clp protease, protease subunit
MADLNLPIPKERNLYLTKQVDQSSIAEISKAIIEINEDDQHLKKIYHVYDIEYKPKPIKIYIDSYGGSCYQCFGLLSIMDKSKTPVHTLVTGCAMSAAFMILISGHKRFAHKLSTPLYHQVSTGFWGKLKDMEEDIAETRRLQNKIEEITLDRTKISKKKLKEVYDGKVDWFMDADQALELGVVDEII